MDNWTTKRCVTSTVYVAIIGLALPIVAGAIGARINGFPFVLGMVETEGLLFFYALHLVAVVSASGLYAITIACKMWGPCRYLPLLTGYGVLAKFYFNFNIAADAQSAIALSFIPFISAGYSFIGFIAAAVLSLPLLVSKLLGR